MSALHLTLLTADAIPIDMTGILPSTIKTLNEAAIAKLPVQRGNRTHALGDLFRIQLQTGELRIEIRDGGAMLTNVGHGMSEGSLIADAVGFHAGARMTGGTLIVDRATDWLGAEMRGGIINVGSVGSQAGAAYRGSLRGMTGGEIIIRGNAGDELGLRMRRGSIHVAGNTGAFTGAAMIAGTIRVSGRLGAHAGAGMKRGTIIAGSFESLSPGFVFACEYSPAYARMIGMKEAVQCWRGDLVTGGRGEVWVTGSARQ